MSASQDLPATGGSTVVMIAAAAIGAAAIATGTAFTRIANAGAARRQGK
jgi:hypothetical protein